MHSCLNDIPWLESALYGARLGPKYLIPGYLDLLGRVWKDVVLYPGGSKYPIIEISSDKNCTSSGSIGTMDLLGMRTISLRVQRTQIWCM